MADRSSRPSTCSHCAGPLSKDMETSSWTIAPLIRDSFSTIGSAVGGTASAFYGFNHAMPIVRKYVKGPMWVHFFIGVLVGTILFFFTRLSSEGVLAFWDAPPVIVFSSACAGLAGGAVPALAQLVSSSYQAAVSSSLLARSRAQDDGVHKARSSSPL